MKRAGYKKGIAIMLSLMLIGSLFFTLPMQTVAQTEEDTVDVTVHYWRFGGDYEGWNLWAWAEERDGKSYPFTANDEYGKIARFQITGLQEGDQIGLLPRRSMPENEWAEKDFSDRTITQWNREKNQVEVWILQGEDTVYYDEKEVDRSPKIVDASIDDWDTISIRTNQPFAWQEAEKRITLSDGIAIQSIEAPDPEQTETNHLLLHTNQKLNLSQPPRLSFEGFGEKTVTAGKVVRTATFDQRYAYNGELGPLYDKKKTDFRLWAPTAQRAQLVVYDHWEDDEGQMIEMKAGKKGTWQTTLSGDQHGTIYTTRVKIGDKWNEAVDPYAKGVTVNGDKGIVLNLKNTNPKGWKPQKKPTFGEPTDAVIYETHVRDLSIHPDSGIQHKGKFLGVAEKGTQGPNGVKTGLDHIKDLGVTHVQFLPIYDYASVDETRLDEPQFNWGYDPKNYNAPEGSYATDPYHPVTRITELKQMVQTLHDERLRVLMDVVYNHVYDVEQSSFHKLVPGYYFRYNEDGTLANGTGVGNDTASERRMMRKFIVDSVTFWAKEYNLDGFRFDLMGIHDVDTMNEVREALDQIDPSILIIGEGWDLNTPLDPAKKANQKNAAQMAGIAHFNDYIRDGLKGSVFEERDAGFVNGKPGMEREIRRGIVGGIAYSEELSTFATSPDQTVTYVEAHDNHTLWDKLELTQPDASEEERKQMHQLATSIVLTSQGISFLHAGQEFMRTKYGDENSYKSPDQINRLDWNRRAVFANEVDYVKGLIQLRLAKPQFRLSDPDEIRERLTFLNSPENTVAYTIAGSQRENTLVIIHNANPDTVEVTLPDSDSWNVLVNEERAGTQTLGTIKGKTVTVNPRSTMVLEKR
ncbi:type I pullulanase [Desmospora activa]|uniref:pullulanase n=1 Tax=Desmospora activa DSM 45169 TaxID=1121389 RepID=A0A2T4Z1N8_9BACL|nr:type I pullulanase [Desmospora activa]PTM54697.1 pullulanase [Desmospora activa DSM 45169]